jgi:glycosyltransferase involved in cell wall biosynthesis
MASAPVAISQQDWFVAAAQQILANIREVFGRTESPSFGPDAEDAFPRPVIIPRSKRRIHLVRRVDQNATQSSFFIRLLSPLTSITGSDFQLTVGEENSPHGADSDVCIVCRDAYDDLDAISALLERSRISGTRIIVDNDDAFGLLRAEEPYADFLSMRNERMKVLMAAAEQCWFSTPRLADEYRQNCSACRIIPNTLDPRLWSTSRPRFEFPANDRVRLLYMGTARHSGDLAMLLPALDAVAARRPGSLELTVMGVAGAVPPRPWLYRLQIPLSARTYPSFIRWLVRQGPFDVGLAPLERTPFNDCKSDIKFLDYSAMGLLSMVSDVPAYTEVAKSRGLAITVENSTDAWTSALAQILESPKKYREIAAAAHRYAWDERSAHRAGDVLAALIAV